MGRTKLRGLMLAGVRVAVEVPSCLAWQWPSRLATRSCLPRDPEVYVAVRVGPVPHVVPHSVVYTHDGDTFEVGGEADERVIAIHGREAFERVARFDSRFRSGEVIVSPRSAAAGRCPIDGPLDELIVIHHAMRSGALVLRGSVAVDRGGALVFLGEGEPPAATAGAGEPGWVIVRPDGDGDGYRVDSLPGAPGAGTSAVGARLQGLHLTDPNGAEAAPQRLSPEEAVPELLRYAFAPVHEPEGADRLLERASAIAQRIPPIRIGAPRVRTFAWRQAGLAFASPLGS